MSESTMRSRVVKILKDYDLDGQPVENVCVPGMPDIYFINGWIETKKTNNWPRKPETVVRLDHGLLPSQKLWIRRHTRKGGQVFVLLQIDREFLLYDGMTAVKCFEESTKQEMIEAAALHCTGWQELEDKLIYYVCVLP